VGTDRTFAVAAFFLLASCAVPRDDGHDEPLGEIASPIQGGFTDARDTGVVGVALLDEGDYVRRTCSGTLVAPNLVLTAQHCVAETAKFVDCRTSVFGAVSAVGRIRVTTSASMWASDASWLKARDVILPPGAPAVCGRDVALIVLATPVDRILALPIPPRLDASPRHEEDYFAIGYGTTGGPTDDAGERRRLDALHVVCMGGACSSGQIEADEWRGDRGICNGDSGGPAIDMGGFVIGVTSRGPAGCEAPIYGGLVGHASWLRDAAKQAAHQGFYANPAWCGGIGGGLDAPRDDDHDDPRAAAGCAVAGDGGGGGEWWWIGTAVLVLARRARRRARRAR
jgi:MYXO-CTERM domain-containing protein